MKTEVHYKEIMPPPSIIPPPRFSNPPSDISAPEKPHTRVNIPSKLSRMQSSSSKPTVRPQTTPSSSLRRFFPGDDEDTEQQPVVEVSSPLVRQQKGDPASSQVPLEKGVWPPPERSEEVQTPKVPFRTEVNSSHVESIQNGEDVAKQAPQSDSPTKDGGGLAPQQDKQAPLVPTLSEKPRQPLVTAVSLPSEPSPAHSMSTPAPPPPSSTVLNSSIDEPHIAKPTHQDKSLKAFYNILAQVGEGTFGKVYKARNSVTGVLVALKRIRMETEKDGFPVTAMREIKLLQSLRHENIVQLYEMIVSNGKSNEKFYPQLLLNLCRFCLHGIRV